MAPLTQQVWWLQIMVYFKSVLALYDPAFILKVDDDLYLRPTGFAAAMQQWQRLSFDYIGCMFAPGDQVFPSDPDDAYYEPSRQLWNATYAYASGGAYAVSGHAARLLLGLPIGSLRVVGAGETLLWCPLNSCCTSSQVLNSDQLQHSHVACSLVAVLAENMSRCTVMDMHQPNGKPPDKCRLRGMCRR